MPKNFGAEKLDLVKTYRSYYSAKKYPDIRAFGQIKYIAIDGQGEPGGISFIEKVQILYPMAFAVKRVCKMEGVDFGVPKLEGLWWVKSESQARHVPKSEWNWKLLIRMPDFVNQDLVDMGKEFITNVRKIRNADLTDFISLNEGSCVQIMHYGPYSEEDKTIDKIEEYILSHGFKKNGLHHEIYLSDPNKTAPEKMKTILRQPVK
jgi:hypothetical protein